ncbi:MULTISPECIES: helix-turn-helix domain-containing protein [unclassified Streptomyces]|uniref:helix-turn-helix domain-containing protein n=1 Tax=unclassified Streptomyces TaxID=2593676 RepID=UPI003827FD59
MAEPTPPGGTADHPHRITDLDALKVFTHPLRIRLYRALFTARTATASQLADQVDEAVSLVSYHLRKLAAHGFIAEAPGHSSDARERWWKVTTERGITFRSSDFVDRPEGAAVMSEVTRHLLATRYERYASYLDQQHAWGKEWSDAGFSSEYLPRLTVEETRQLGAELDELMTRWADRARAAEDTGDTAGREHVAVHLYGFPYRS